MALRARDLFGDTPNPNPSLEEINIAITRANAANAMWQLEQSKENAHVAAEVPELGSATEFRMQTLRLDLSASPGMEWWRSSTSTSTELSDPKAPVTIEVNTARFKTDATLAYVANFGQTWHWKHKPWGWEAVRGPLPPLEPIPNERAQGLIYALKVSHEDPDTGEPLNFIVEVLHYKKSRIPFV